MTVTYCNKAIAPWGAPLQFFFSLLLKKNPIIKYLKCSRLQKEDNLSIWEINNNNKKYRMGDRSSKPNKNFICRIQIKYDFFGTASLWFTGTALQNISYIVCFFAACFVLPHAWLFCTNVLTLESFLNHGSLKSTKGFLCELSWKE